MLRRQANGVWHVDFQLFGQRYHRSARTKHRRQAQGFEDRLRRELVESRLLGLPAPIETCSLGEAVDRYIKEHLEPHSKNPRSHETNVWMYQSLCVRLGGRGILLEEIDSARVARLKASLVEAGSAKATANRYLALLSAVLKKAGREWGLKTASPTVQLFRLNNGRTRCLTVEEESRLFADLAKHNLPLLRLAQFLLWTGARLGEALNLTWADVELEHRPFPSVTFRATKNGDTRRVPLTPAVVDMLRGAPRLAGCPHVFLTQASGRSVDRYKQPHRSFIAARRRANVPNFHIHDLRHTFASRLVERGASLYQVGKLLGHRDPRMTARYAHLSAEGLAGVVALMAVPSPLRASDP